MTPAQRTPRSILVVSAFLLVALPTPATGQWLPNGTPLTTAVGIQDQVSAVSDGAGGMIVVWRDQRTDAGDIYTQRISGGGLSLWTAGGVAVCTAANGQLLPQIVSDGAGGAIMAWQDNRTDPLGDIYAQHVDRSGARLWALNGAPLVSGVSENVQTPSRFRMIPDGVGGAMLTFCDNRRIVGGPHPGVPKIWAQRVTGLGVPLWGGGGVPVAAGTASYENASLAADGYGGIIVAWSDNSAGNWNIGSQHLDSNGLPVWGGGITLCSASGDQLHPEAIADALGGVVVAWQDNRADPNGDIYGQRVNALGVVQWTPDGKQLVSGPSANNAGEYIIRGILSGDGVTFSFADDRLVTNVPDPGQSKVWAQRINLAGLSLWSNGVPVAAGAGSHAWHRIQTDAEGGAIVVWQDGTTASNTNIFAQRLSAAGLPQWGPGVSVCNAFGLQAAPAALADGLGGVLCAWTDARAGVADVYAQFINFSGVPSGRPRWGSRSWWPDGADVIVRSDLQSNPDVTPDGAGGAIIVWRDERGDLGDIYVQRMSSQGAPMWTLGGTPICVSTGFQQQPRIVSDGVGGAIIVWQDGRTDPFGDLYAQRINAQGTVLWALNGVPIVSGPSVNLETIESFRAVPDGVGGLIAVFQDTRRPDGVVIGTPHIWTQRVDGSGSALWGNGVPVSLAYSEQVACIPDAAGGVIVSWSQEGGIWGQRIDSAGTALWGPGTRVVDAGAFSDIASDAAGGAIFAWLDFRADPNGDIYAQRVNPTGAVAWAVNGVPIVTGPSSNFVVPIPPELHHFIRMIPDNLGGSFLTFIDTRGPGGVLGPEPKVWAQRISPSGSPGWANGVPVGVKDGPHYYHSIVTDAEGGSIIVWQHDDPAADWNIMAQRLDATGSPYWGPGILVSDQLNDQTRVVATFDGRGNAIAAWADAKADPGDIRAERISTPNGVISDVATESRVQVPQLLSTPAPNPTNSSVSWTVTVTRPGKVQVFLADVQGRVVAIILDRHLEAGTHAYTWSARDSHLATGVYFLSVRSSALTEARKLILLR